MIELHVPQLGEGLREVRIVELLRRSGDSVRRGDALYVIETDKTTIEMESSHDGRLLGWRVAPGDVVPIGAAVAVIGEDQEERRAVTVPEVEPRLVPPRTRAYAKSKGLTDDALDAIPSETEKLLPSDIDAFLASPLSGTTLAGNYREHRVTGTARTLIYRLRRSLSTVVPGTVAIDVPSSLFVRQGQSAGSIRPTSFQVFGHAVAIIAQGHAKFRSIMVRDDVIREYDQVNIGMALARSNDELITAVIRGAGQMALEEFVSACTRQMRAALREGDQASDDTQILLTHLGEFGIVDAVPTLVAPANCVLFLGARQEHCEMARIGMTFDHRLMNGALAAGFLNAVAGYLAQS